MGNGTSRPSLKNCTLWKADRSPACRAVLMALDAMNINVREIDVNLDKGEHRSAEITAMNPRQTLPILKDKDLVLCDSNAIAAYMVSRYGAAAAKTLLPSDPAGRALVEQYMHFNSSVLYPQYKAASVRPIFYSQSQYPRLASWLSRISERNFYITANKKGLAEFVRRIDVSETVKEPKKVVKEGQQEPPFFQQDISPVYNSESPKPIKQRESIPGDNIDVQRPKYRGGRCCYLADLPELRKTDKKETKPEGRSELLETNS